VDPHLLADVRLVLASAERAGLRQARAEAVRRLLDASQPSVAHLEAAERWLRSWLARRPSPAGEAPAAPAVDAAPVTPLATDPS
jgi:hypothetical protein